MLAVWNRQLIPWMFRWNNWKLEKLPILEWLRPGETNIQSLAQSYSMLVQNQLLDVNDVELRARVRMQLGLKKLDKPEEKVIPKPQLGNQAPFDRGAMSERLFSDFTGSELVDTVLEFITSIVTNVLGGTQDLGVGRQEISDVNRDFRIMEESKRITPDERQQVSSGAFKALRILDSEAFRREDNVSRIKHNMPLI